MAFLKFFKIILLLIGDLAVFLLSLYLSILIRYNFSFNPNIFYSASLYFLPVFLMWLVIFVIGRMYELSYAINKRAFFERIIRVFTANIIFAILYFYIFTPNYYRPKLVLIITVILSFFLFNLWRVLANIIIKLKKIRIKINSSKPLAQEIRDTIITNPQLGYQIEDDITKAALIVQDEKDKDLRTISLMEFAESITGRVSLDLLTPTWFQIIIETKDIIRYESIKRVMDFIGAVILLLISLPLWPLIALAIKLDSSGPVLYRSTRLGKNRKKFFIYKFRTMVPNADKIGPSWTLKGDLRITKVGKILRFTHLDELPQVINILKGDISFVGPRPEEEKLIELFDKEIPFYQYRFLMLPGVIGWAQINYPHGASIEDARKKLEYDFYYFKNRSLVFDFIISLKAWRIPFEIPTH